MNKLLIATAVSATMLTGCASMSNQEQGQIIGATVGSIAAYNLSKGHKDRGLAIAIGALAGSLVGSSVGAELDARDRQLHTASMQTALETYPDNNVAGWNNPNTGHSGSVVPVNTWQATSGQYCREYQQTIVVGGEQVQGYGTACRKPDGSWEIVQ